MLFGWWGKILCPVVIVIAPVVFDFIIFLLGGGCQDEEESLLAHAMTLKVVIESSCFLWLGISTQAPFTVTASIHWFYYEKKIAFRFFLQKIVQQGLSREKNHKRITATPLASRSSAAATCRKLPRNARRLTLQLPLPPVVRLVNLRQLEENLLPPPSTTI